MTSPVDRATAHLGYERTISSLTHARMFLRFSLESLPQSAASMSKDLIEDARDGVDMAIEALEGQEK